MKLERWWPSDLCTLFARKTGMVALVYGTGQMVRTGRRGMGLAVEGTWRAERLCNGLELCFRFSEDENSGRNSDVERCAPLDFLSQ